MNSDFKVAVIGAGQMAREHIRVFADLPGVCVAGIASRTAARAQGLASEFGIATVCESITELHERTGAQLAVVAVSAQSMCAVACECCAHPWAMLLEKPPGYNVGQAETIQRVARKYSRKIFVGLNRRFLSSTRVAVADLSRRPGPRHIQVLDQQEPARIASLGHPPEILEHLMFANSIHVIDYFRIFGRGAIRSVRPIFAWDASRPWLVSAAIDFAGGDTGLYQGIWGGPGPWAVAVNTREVRWEMRPLEQATYQLAGERRAIPVEVSVYDMKFKPGFRLQAEQVVAAARAESSEAPSLDEAVETMHLIHMLYNSSHAGTKRRQRNVRQC